jgi:hypothetical protein
MTTTLDTEVTPLSLWSEENWCKGIPPSGSNLECLVTAVGRFCGGTALWASWSAINQAAARLFPTRCVDRDDDSDLCIAAQVNDHPDTTWADIQAILREAGLL